GDAARALRDDHPDPRAGRLHGRETTTGAVTRYVPDHGRAVVGAADRRRDHRRRADVLPCSLARTDRRTADAERRKDLLTWHSTRCRLTSAVARGASSGS